MRRARIGLAAALVLVVSCSIPADDEAQAIPVEELPESLRPGFIPTSTLAPAPQTEPRTVYLLTNPQNIERTVVVAVEREVRRGGDVAEVLRTLFGTPTTEEEQAQGYFNTLELFELTSAERVDDVVTVDVARLEPDDLPPPAETLELIAAQLVWTAVDQGIAGVRILLEGEEISIPTSDADAPPGEVLTRDRFEQFLPDLPAANSTTTEPPTTEVA